MSRTGQEWDTAPPLRVPYHSISNWYMETDMKDMHFHSQIHFFTLKMKHPWALSSRSYLLLFGLHWFTEIEVRVGFLKHRLVSQHIGSTYNVRVTRLDAKNTKKIKITSKKLTGNKLESKAISAGLCDRSTTFLVDLNLSLKDTGSDLKRSFLTQ